MAMMKTLWGERYSDEIALAYALNRKYKGLSLATAFSQWGFIRFIMVASNKEKVINFITYDDDIRYTLAYNDLSDERLKNYYIDEINCGAYGEIEVILKTD